MIPRSFGALALLLCALGALAPAARSADPISMDESMSVVDVVHAHVAHSDDLDVSMFREGTYVVAFWKATSRYAGGSALLKKTAGSWALIKLIASAFKDESELEALGVPAVKAKAFIADLEHAT